MKMKNECLPSNHHILIPNTLSLKCCYLCIIPLTQKKIRLVHNNCSQKSDLYVEIFFMPVQLIYYIHISKIILDGRELLILELSKNSLIYLAFKLIQFKPYFLNKFFFLYCLSTSFAFPIHPYS